MTTAKMDLLRRGILSTIIILGVFTGLWIYIALNEHESIFREGSCLIKREPLGKQKVIDFYCIDGYAYISQSTSENLIPQAVGNHHFFPRKCRCSSLKKRK